MISLSQNLVYQMGIGGIDVHVCHFIVGHDASGFLYGNAALFSLGRRHTSPALGVIIKEVTSRPLLSGGAGRQFLERHLGELLERQKRLEQAAHSSGVTLEGVCDKLGSLVRAKVLPAQLSGGGFLLVPDDGLEQGQAVVVSPAPVPLQRFVTKSEDDSRSGMEPVPAVPTLPTKQFWRQRKGQTWPICKAA